MVKQWFVVNYTWMLSVDGCLLIGYCFGELPMVVGGCVCVVCWRCAYWLLV